jgi:hypothetical protein
MDDPARALELDGELLSLPGRGGHDHIRGGEFGREVTVAQELGDSLAITEDNIPIARIEAEVFTIEEKPPFGIAKLSCLREDGLDGKAQTPPRVQHDPGGQEALPPLALKLLEQSVLEILLMLAFFAGRGWQTEMANLGEQGLRDRLRGEPHLITRRNEVIDKLGELPRRVAMNEEDFAPRFHRGQASVTKKALLGFTCWKGDEEKA